MIQPDPMERITAQEAHQHRALAIDVNTDMSTPPFVRTAASLPLEPKEKKQVPREKRDQKRSQALQAETGAKFIKSDNRTKMKQVEKAVEKGPTEARALAPLLHHDETKPSTRASPPSTKLNLTEYAKSIPVERQGASAELSNDAEVMGAAPASPVDIPVSAAVKVVLESASKQRDYLHEVKMAEPTVSAGKQDKRWKRTPVLIAPVSPL